MDDLFDNPIYIMWRIEAGVLVAKDPKSTSEEGIRLKFLAEAVGEYETIALEILNEQLTKKPQGGE